MSDSNSSNRRSTLASSLSSFLKGPGKDLHLGGNSPFLSERREHTETLGWTHLPQKLRDSAPIAKVEYTAVIGPHGTIPIRLFYPSSGSEKKGALVYMHGGGYTVGCVDDFERGLRVIAETSGCVTIGVDYKLAPEWKFPVQLDEFEAVFDWAIGDAGKQRGIDTEKICCGGDSAGGNMTAALALRLKDQGKKNMHAQFLLYPEARVPFDTQACIENNTGYYLEANGIFSFADHYLPLGVPPTHRYVSPGMQPTSALASLPQVYVFTSGFDPLRDVGIEYAEKLKEAGGTKVEHAHHPDLTHGFVQFGGWSEECEEATKGVGKCLKEACA